MINLLRSVLLVAKRHVETHVTSPASSHIVLTPDIQTTESGHHQSAETHHAGDHQEHDQ